MRIIPECFNRLFLFVNDDIGNMRDASTPKLNLPTKIFHVDSFVVLFSSIFLLCGDLKFDLMFFIQLIWWIRTRQIFKKFYLAKMFQILLYTLLNLFDSPKLIKLIWLCISGDLFVNLFAFFALSPAILKKAMAFSDHSVHVAYLGFHMLLCLSTIFFYHWIMCSPIITGAPKEIKTRWSSGEILSSVSLV